MSIKDEKAADLACIVSEIGDPVTLTANFGVKLKEHCDPLKASCELVYLGAPNVKRKTINEFMLTFLTPED